MVDGLADIKAECQELKNNMDKYINKLHLTVAVFIAVLTLIVDFKSVGNGLIIVTIVFSLLASVYGKVFNLRRIVMKAIDDLPNRGDEDFVSRISNINNDLQSNAAALIDITSVIIRSLQLAIILIVILDLVYI